MGTTFNRILTGEKWERDDKYFLPLYQYTLAVMVNPSTSDPAWSLNRCYSTSWQPELNTSVSLAQKCRKWFDQAPSRYGTWVQEETKCWRDWLSRVSFYWILTMFLPESSSVRLHCFFRLSMLRFIRWIMIFAKHKHLYQWISLLFSFAEHFLTWITKDWSFTVSWMVSKFEDALFSRGKQRTV